MVYRRWFLVLTFIIGGQLVRTGGDHYESREACEQAGKEQVESRPGQEVYYWCRKVTYVP